MRRQVGPRVPLWGLPPALSEVPVLSEALVQLSACPPVVQIQLAAPPRLVLPAVRLWVPVQEVALRLAWPVWLVLARQQERPTEVRPGARILPLAFRERLALPEALLLVSA